MIYSKNIKLKVNLAFGFQKFSYCLLFKKLERIAFIKRFWWLIQKQESIRTIWHLWTSLDHIRLYSYKIRYAYYWQIHRRELTLNHNPAFKNVCVPANPMVESSSNWSRSTVSVILKTYYFYYRLKNKFKRKLIMHEVTKY